jgi:hypothetical protein
MGSKIVGQIEKQIEVITFYHTDEETIFFRKCNIQNRLALLFDEKQIQNIIKK